MSLTLRGVDDARAEASLSEGTHADGWSNAVQPDAGGGCGAIAASITGTGRRYRGPPPRLSFAQCGLAITRDFKSFIPAIWIAHGSDLMSMCDTQLRCTAQQSWERKMGANTPPIRTEYRWLVRLEMEYEVDGIYAGCVLPCGKMLIDGVLYVYYGGADRIVAWATCPLDELLKHLRTCPA